MKTILLTGANGFVGSAIYDALASSTLYNVIPVVRKGSIIDIDGVKFVDDFDANSDWRGLLEGIDIVIHTAGKAGDGTAGSLESYRAVNTAATLNLAQQAAMAGVDRFVFISSLKVNGETTAMNDPITEHTPAEPVGAYAVSKHEAEIGLNHIAANSSLDVVTIRPPMVYGQNAKGNFSALIALIKRRYPLPFGMIHNLRSFVSIDNLTDFILTALEHPSAPKGVLFVSDGEDVSTTDLMCRLADAIKSPLCLFPVPVPVMLLIAAAFGKKNVMRSLTGSFQVDITGTCERLNWKPAISMEKGLAYLASKELHK
jgi:nucleoside-diphosphate-sugar epimerase